MPTLNLLESLTLTEFWNIDEFAPYDMQPYYYSPIQTNVVLDAANPILEIINIPVGSMIADPPLNTAPYDSSFIINGNGDEITFKVVNGIPTIYNYYAQEAGYSIIIESQEYIEGEVNRINSVISVYLYDVFESTINFSILLQYASIQNGILTGNVDLFYDETLDSSYLLNVNEIISSYSVVSTDIANRKAVIRVDKSIDNLKPPLNRLFLNFDKTP